MGPFFEAAQDELDAFLVEGVGLDAAGALQDDRVAQRKHQFYITFITHHLTIPFYHYHITSHHSLPFPPLNSLASPITPQATLAPEFPVVSESVCPPSPRSSSFACTTTDLPTTEYSPNSDTTPSVKHSLHSPFPSATRLPKSPTCLLVLLGPPWVVLCGL